MADQNTFEEDNRPLDKRLLRYVWRHTRADQIWILCVIIASMPTYFMVLDLPVRIINQPIQGVGFEDATATQPFLRIELSAPDFLGGGSVRLVDGWEMERWPYLIALSTLFLLLVCVNGLFKFYINTFKGRLGERMLRRMRYSLTDRVLRFPIHHFRRVKGSEVASMVKDEIEPFGEFIGDAFVQPAFLGSQALVAFIFILTNSFWLGLIAVAVIVIQVNLIPYLRRPVLRLGRERQLTARLLSGRIGEIVEGITAVHVNDTSNYERSEIANRLSRIFFIRYELYQRKFFIKFLNNFLAQLTPFLFYVVGGYLAIRGTLNVGQLIGVINAYKDLPSPINGLIMWDQKRTDINIKYAQIVEQFNVRGMQDAELQAPSSDPVPPLEGDIQVSNLNVTDETGSVLIEDADFTLPIHGITAAIGPIGSGAGAVANTLAGLYTPTSGRVTLNGSAVADLPESIRGRRFAYAGSESYLPQNTLLDTLVYVTKHAPLRESDPDKLPEPVHPRAQSEAIAAGNTLLDFHADWVDYEAMGISGPEQLYEKVHEVLDLVDMEEVVYDLAMRQHLDPRAYEDFCKRLIEARHTFRNQLADSELSEFIEVFDWDAYNHQATVAENLLFGTAVESDDLDPAYLVQNDYLRDVLRKADLERALFEMGVELAETAIELFADLSPDNPFFEQLNFMTPEQLEAYPPILARAKEKGFDGVVEADRRMLLQLPLSYVEPRNRLRLLDDDIRERILAARKDFHDGMPEELAERISRYHIDTYNPFNTVRDNILFGRIAYGSSRAQDEINTEIRLLLREMGLDEEIFRIGLDFDIGTGGKRLTENQRQRIVMARALLKGADLLIVNRAMVGLDLNAQNQIVERILKRARGEEGDRPFGVLWVLNASEFADRFDNVLVFGQQRLKESGSPAELAETSEVYRDLTGLA